MSDESKNEKEETPQQKCNWYDVEKVIPHFPTEGTWLDWVAKATQKKEQ